MFFHDPCAPRLFFLMWWFVCVSCQWRLSTAEAERPKEPVLVEKGEKLGGGELVN